MLEYERMRAMRAKVDNYELNYIGKGFIAKIVPKYVTAQLYRLKKEEEKNIDMSIGLDYEQMHAWELKIKDIF